MHADELKIQGRLQAIWLKAQHTVMGINSGAHLRPKDHTKAFTYSSSTPETTTFDFEAITFKLPERGENSALDLYIVISGNIVIRRSSASAASLQTDSFKTIAAYFKYKNGQANHTCGMHHDFDLQTPRHPFFHSQFRDYPELWPVAATEFKLDAQVNNFMQNILGTVRIPTAQLDIFSLFAQVFADHLLHKNSPKDAYGHFNSFLSHANGLQGAAFQLPKLANIQTAHCYRAHHWYP